MLLVTLSEYTAPGYIGQVSMMQSIQRIVDMNLKMVFTSIDHEFGYKQAAYSAWHVNLIVLDQFMGICKIAQDEPSNTQMSN